MTREECRARAAECVRMAQNAREPHRSQLLELANAWLTFDDDDAAINPPTPAQLPGRARKHDGRNQ